MASAETTTYPYIEKREGQPARLRRTPRVRVAQIVTDYLNYGWTVDQMCRQYSYLTPAEGHAAMLYYFDHKEEIDAEIEAEAKEVERVYSQAPPSDLRDRLKAKGLL